MKLHWILTAIAIALGFALNARAQLQTFHKTETREKLLRLRANPVLAKLEARGEFTDPKAEALFKYLDQQILPVYNDIVPCFEVINVTSVMINAGLYKNKAELKSWTKQRSDCQERTNAFQVNEEFTSKLKRFSELSEGLTGNLADQARRDYRDRVRWSFGPEQQDLLNELSTLEDEFDLVQETVPANEDLIALQGQREETARQFRAGEISYADAHEIFKKNLEAGGSHLVGYQAQQALPKHMERIAIIRSLLAKSKGHATWAAYQLANDEGYDVRYRGVETQRQYLHRLLNILSPRLNAMIAERVSELGIDPESVTTSYKDLIHPANTRDLNAYLPPQTITPIWLETMKESGFKDSTLNMIFVDDGKRKNKMTNGAYSAAMQEPFQEVSLIDAATLDYIVPPAADESWKPGLNYILQTYKNGGHDDIETMFHEGGHALEAMLKHKSLSTEEAYGYVETPSTSMEYFLQDAEFLHAKLVPVDGVKPSLEEVKELIQNGNFARLDIWHLIAQRALMDIDMWDYDYSLPGALTFVQRIEEVYDQTQRLALERPDRDRQIPAFFNRMGTTHHVSGDVRYIGYVFADLSALQMANYVSDELEKQTGRRSWLKQPGLAEIFGDRFYAEGWKTSFPENIEKITGRSFDPEVLIQDFFAKMKAPADSESDCSQALKVSPRRPDF